MQEFVPKKIISMIESNNLRKPELAQWARDSIAIGQEKFQDVEQVVDPNSNESTDNQKSICIASEFLKNSSPKFLKQELASSNKDRLVKVGRSVADLFAREDGSKCDESNEDVLELGLANIVEQCDILASDNLQVSRRTQTPFQLIS